MTNTQNLSETQQFQNKSFQIQLDDSLKSGIALSVFLFIAAININTTQIKFNSDTTNKIIILGLILLSIGFALAGLIQFTTEFFDDLNDEKHRYTFNYGLAIVYTIFVSFLIIIEILFAKEFLNSL